MAILRTIHFAKMRHWLLFYAHCDVMCHLGKMSDEANLSAAEFSQFSSRYLGSDSGFKLIDG